jgi:selT/selW/selH-like putative selenoprotein
MMKFVIKACNSCGYDNHAGFVKKFLLEEYPGCSVVEEALTDRISVFEIYLDGKLIFSKDEKQRFPEEPDLRGMKARL